MATIGYGSKYIYTGHSCIPPENLKPYRNKGGSKVYQSWDFGTSELKTWLNENCSGEWDYDYGTENDDETMQVKIFFESDIDAMAFILKWE